MKTAKEKILKSIKNGVAEIKKIEAGKMVGQPANEMIAELIAERDKRGGARAGAGKKTVLKSKYPLETRKSATIRVYPSQLDKIKNKFGSLQAAIDALDI